MSHRPALVTINLSALRHNYQLAAGLAATSQTMAVIKADAYGHGAVATAKALSPLAPAFAVASLDEAMQLRDAGITQPILVLAGAFSVDEVIMAAEANYWLMVENIEQVARLLSAPISKPANVWLKADTGMHRLGLQQAEFQRVYRQLKESEKVQEVVLTTHLACADEINNDMTAKQIACFEELTHGITEPVSIANSAGILGWPLARRDWNRAGYMLYGLSPFTVSHPAAKGLRPVMALTSAVMSVRKIAAGEPVGYGGSWVAQRPSTIPTVAVGYGDGYPRHAVNGTPVWVNHQRAPLVGRVSMDMITVDVTTLDNVMIGTEVELWGSNLSANEVAAHGGTIF